MEHHLRGVLACNDGICSPRSDYGLEVGYGQLVYINSALAKIWVVSYVGTSMG